MTKKATNMATSKEKTEEAENQEVVDKKKTTKASAENNDKETAKKSDRQTSGQAKSKRKSTAKKASKDDSKIKELEEKFELAKESAGEWQDKYMRLSAEFDNYRKRTLKEKSELTKQANGDLLKDILPVVDDFERGHDNLEKATDLDGLKEGISLIYNKFTEFLRQNGIKEIEAKEQDFDIDYHEALTKIPAPTEDLKGKVVDVIEKGYLLNDKVIRYAKVVVGE